MKDHEADCQVVKKRPTLNLIYSFRFLLAFVCCFTIGKWQVSVLDHMLWRVFEHHIYSNFLNFKIWSNLYSGIRI